MFGYTCTLASKEKRKIERKKRVGKYEKQKGREKKDMEMVLLVP